MTIYIVIECDDCGYEIDYSGDLGNIQAMLIAAGWTCDGSMDEHLCPRCVQEQADADNEANDQWGTGEEFDDAAE